MHLVTVNDAKTGLSFQYDADMKIATADDGLAFFVSQLSNTEAKIYETKYRNIVYQDFIPIDTSDPEWVDEVTYISYDAVTVGKFIGANARRVWLRRQLLDKNQRPPSPLRAARQCGRR